jgi:hypothetical protein
MRDYSLATRAFPVLVVTALVLGSASSAAAYQDTGHDPDDRPHGPQDPDIHRTKRRVFSTPDGRMLKIRVRAYGEFGFWWEMDVALDSRGGSAVDFRMWIQNNDNSGRVCWIFPAGHPGQGHSGHFRQDGDLASCRVRARFADPNKQIRWKIVSESRFGGETERAPDQGFYS